MRTRSPEGLRPLFPVLLVGALFGASVGRAEATVITAFPVNFPAAEQSSFSGTVATFSDDNPSAIPADFTTSIDWGDGSPVTAGIIVAGSGDFSVQGTHTYADEGSFTVTVKVLDAPPGSGTATATDSATVSEADSLSGTPISFSEPSGVSFTAMVASFTDTLASAVTGDLTATIDWGDATSSAGTVTGGGGSFSVNGMHTYAGAGTFPVMVTLSDDAPGTATATVTSTAHVAAGLAVSGAGFTIPEHAVFNGTVATFSDSDTSKTPADFTATIDWGDATSSAGTASGGTGSFAVTGQHTYDDEGSFTVTVTVTETGIGGATADGTGTASVSEADALSGTPVTFNAQATVPFSGTVAAFTDTDTTSMPADFVATIDWGDATNSAGTVAGGSGSFTVSGSHRYVAPGTFTVTVTLADDPPGTATATASSTANVAPAPVVPTLDFGGLLVLVLAVAVAAVYLLR